MQPYNSYIMSQNLPTQIMLFIYAFLIFLNLSCAKDTDLFLEAVLEDEEELVETEETSEEQADENTDSGNSSNTDPAPADFQESKPNTIIGTFSPTSAAEISDPSKANYKAIIETSFDCNGCTFAKDLTIEPAGGSISGSAINLNGAFIENNFKQAFSSNISFDNVYVKTRLSPETFGAIANDNTADDIYISALIAQVSYATAQSGGVYIKNTETVHDRNGVFDWNMNGAVLKTTNSASLSHGAALTNQHKYLFKFENLNVVLSNGELDGQDLASRCVNFNYVDSYHLDNMYIHNYYAPPNAFARAVAVKLYIGDNFTGGSMKNTIIENIGAASDNNANNAPFGVAKGISASIRTNNPTVQNITGCTINNIYGDDAEGFYNAPAQGYFGTYDYSKQGAQFNFENNIFRACQRRAFKINASNVSLTNNEIESATNDWIFSGAQATLVHIFSIKNAQPISNVNVSDNTVKTIGDARNVAFGISDATNCLIENNTFEASHIMAQRNINIAVSSSQGGLYNGDLSNTVIFRNNTITNYFINLNPLYNAVNGGPVIEGNVQNLTIDRGIGIYWGAFNLKGVSGDYPSEITLKNHTINVNQTFDAGVLFGGVFNTQGQNPKNITFNNVDINYTGISPANAFAYTGKNNTAANFDRTNSIVDCNIVGASGVGAVNVLGSDASVVITNSYGDGFPITIE